jgi:hypothetical protein
LTARSPQNRIKNWTGTVHYADDHGTAACGTDMGRWTVSSVATVTCTKCIAKYGADEQGHTDPTTTHYADDHAARRAAERAARKSA